MLLLDAASKLQLTASVAAGAGGIHYTTSKVRNGGSFTPIPQKGVITGTGATDITAAPGGSEVDTVESVTICNADTAAAPDILIESVGGTTVRVFRALGLKPGESIQMTEAGLWAVFDVNGAMKNASSVYDPRMCVKELLADQSNSTTTLTEVTALSLLLQPGTYAWRYVIRYQAGATTTGVRFSVNFSGTVTSFLAQRTWVASINTTSSDAPTQTMVAALGGVQSAFNARAKSTAGWGTTLSVDSANADMLEIIEGSMVVTVAGDLELWHGSEVAAASTVKAGTMLVTHKAV